MGSEIYFYRNASDSSHEFMHNMIGSYSEIKENKMINIEHKQVGATPMKLLVGP